MDESPENPPQPPQAPLAELLVSTPEGRVLLAGLALTLAYLVWLAVCFILDPDHGHILLSMTATEIVFGRAACMTLGYSLGLGNRIVIPLCVAVETLSVLIVYGLIVLGCRHLIVFKWMRKTLEAISEAARRHQNTIQRYGIIGLFLFVWFPFWMTGPVVGCVIGFLLGLRTWVNLTVVLGATYVAITGWALFLRHIHGRLAAFNPYGSFLLFVLVILLVLAGRYLYRRRHRLPPRQP